MADGKRPAGGPKITVATPNIGGVGAGPASAVPFETALAGCIGARIRLTTTLNTTLEGTLFTADPVTNLVAICTTPPSAPPSQGSAVQSPLPGDYRIIPISKLQSFQLLALAPDAAASGIQDVGARMATAAQALKKVDWSALRAREKAAVDKELRRERARGPGVGKEAQDIFDTLSRTLPVSWQDQTIVVLDSIIIHPPYGPEDCRAAPKDGTALQRVKKVLEMEKRKVLERNLSAKSNATSVGGGNNVAANTGASLPGNASDGIAHGNSKLLNAAPAVAAVPVPLPVPAGARKGG